MPAAATPNAQFAIEKWRAVIIRAMANPNACAMPIIATEPHNCGQSITIDMIRGYCAEGNNTDMQQAVYIAAILGFTIVARLSKYLDT